MITIGQLAAYAGVTIKAVRHYHRHGLLPEPPRDSSGYRRYDAEHAIQLVKIRTLAQGGVPLARIKSLLAASPEEFDAAITEIDRSLRDRAAEIRRTRERIGQLRGGDRLFVSAPVADFLQSLKEIGVSERGIQMERDGWILLQSVAPEQATRWVEEKRESLRDQEFREIYLDFDRALDWSPDDPRLRPMAERMHRWLSSRTEDTIEDATLARLISSATGSTPSWDRLAEYAAELDSRGLA